MISIILPYYNDSQFLPFALGSCLMQDIPVEIVVINDASTIPPSGRVSRLIDSIADRYMINENNVGLARTRDIAIRFCKYDLIVPLDCDDVLMPNALVDMYNALEDYDVVHGNLIEYDFGPICRPPGKNGVTREGLLKDNQVWCTNLFRKSLWEKVGGYENGMRTSYEDYTYVCKCFMAGAKYKYIDRVIYRHTTRPDSMLGELHSKTEHFKQIARKPLFA